MADPSLHSLTQPPPPSPTPAPSPPIDILLVATPPIPSVSEILYTPSPAVAKEHWTQTAIIAKSRENPSSPVRGHQFFTLRLDGVSFGRFITSCRALRLFPQGYSSHFSKLMLAAAEAVQRRVHGTFVFTQSDEMTILVPPCAQAPDGSYPPHMYAGRVAKLTTLAASLATHAFGRALDQLAREKGVDLLSDQYLAICGLFDCRLGVFDTHDDALRLVLWRAYECAMNGVSDRVFQMHDVAEAKEVRRKHTGVKLRFMEAHGVLPMSDHQAYGTVIRKVFRPKDPIKPVNKEWRVCMRGVFEQKSENLLTAYVRHVQLKEEGDFLTLK